MSNSKMLIDAAHPEETRVVVLKGNRVEEFDFESASKKQLRGNIYLAKVTRVEPSLQAAFVEYGGNRHGFLAFSEIHPDYYQIPFADRQALLEEEARAHRDEDDEPRESREGRGGENRGDRGDRGGRRGGERGGQRNESRGESRTEARGEARDGRSDKEAVEGGEARPERNGRGEGRSGDREGRNERGRGERGQRRSRRHRRDSVPASALDRRGPADESVSEPAFEADEELTGVGIPAEEIRAVEVLVPGSDGTEASEGSSVDAQVEARSEPATALATEGAAISVESALPGELSDDATGEASGRGPFETTTEAAAEATGEATAQSGSEMPAEADAAAPTGEGIEAADELLPQAEQPTAVEAEAEQAHADVVAAAAESYVAEAHADDAPHGGRPEAGAASDATSAVVAVDEMGLGIEAVQVEAMQAEVVEASPIADLSDAPEARDVPGRDDDGSSPAEAVGEAEEEHVEQIGGDALSDVAPRPVRLRRHYKIQEVIKRRQILLIQVVKEERGNKGAALTTYLSLAGRYSVLMPNTAKGGGISRKITDGEDRKRLKAIANELDVPEGMGVILRTAGASRSPVEVKRDFEYLLRMWESVRELTLKSSAPTLVYEEGSLIKRSIRDLYSKEVEEIVVSGEAGFAEARDFMRMLMPGNVKSVLEYRDPSPIFAKSGVEAQLDAMFSAHVTLKSGGYLVINQTEALVAIDVNSGRSTREHNIEDTALRTNMEAADEVARQLRLRDLAGLIVVDFIDMEEGRNNRAVERRIKEALKNDRARIQIGRISHFGLLEMSRQRIRTGVLEGSTVMCPHCAGAGTVRSTASIALHVLRLVEDALIKDAAYDLVVRSRGEVALYMLNQKRAKLVELEQRFGVTISVEGDPSLTGTAYHAIERGDLATPAEAPMPRQDLVRVDSIAPIFEPEIEEAPEILDVDEGEAEGVDETAENTEATEAAGFDAGSESGEGGERRRKRRRRRRGRDRDGATSEIGAEVSGERLGEGAQPSDEALAALAGTGGDGLPEPLPVIGFSAEPSGADEVGTDAFPGDEAEVAAADRGPADIDAAKPAEVVAEASEASAQSPAQSTAEAAELPATAVAAEAPASSGIAEAAEEAPKRRRSRRTAARTDDDAAPAAEAEGEAGAPASVEEAPKRRRRPSRARAAEAEAADPVEAGEASPSSETAVTQLQSTQPTVTQDPVAEVAAEEPVGARPSADRDVGADTVEHHAPETGAVGEATQAAGAEAVAAEPQPDRPKRSGWWQRAKTSFGS